MGKYFCIIFLLTIYSCNLNVVDTNNPDRSSVFSNPIKIETLAKNAFLSYWQVTHGNLINGVNVKANLYATSLVAANQYTSSWYNYAWGYVGMEPRIPWDNTISVIMIMLRRIFIMGCIAY